MIVIIFYFKFINDNDNDNYNNKNSNKNNTNDYKLGSDIPVRPKFLGSGSPNNNKNNNIYNISNNIKLVLSKFL